MLPGLLLLLACAVPTGGDSGEKDCTPSRWFTDRDGDGYGDPAAQISACETPAGAVLDATDCDDGQATVHPHAGERCNGYDDDCDGLIDDDDHPLDGQLLWYADHDADGYAASTDEAAVGCAMGEGWALQLGDCDDADPEVWPGWGVADMDCDGRPGLSVGTAHAVVRGEKINDMVGSTLLVADATGDGEPDLLVSGTDGIPGWGALWLLPSSMLKEGGEVSVWAASGVVVGGAQSDRIAGTTASVGDIDGDGAEDVVADASESPTCKLYLYSGANFTGSRYAEEAEAGLEADPDWCAWPLGASKDDLDGDGERELIVSASGYPDAHTYDGRLLLASMSQVRAGGRVEDARTIIDGGDSAMFGAGGSTADLDGDGRSDLLVAAGSEIHGTGPVYRFSATTLDGGGRFDVADADASIGSRQESSSLGLFMAPMGDLNGDGAIDVGLLSTGEYGLIWLVSGASVTGAVLAEDIDFAVLQGDPDFWLTGSLTDAGDVDGDGLHDLLTGSVRDDGDDTNAGRAFVHLGARLRLGGAIALVSEADAIFTSTAAEQYVGESLSTAGDLNGDGRDDLYIGAPGERSDLGYHIGAVYLFTSTM